MHPHFRASQNHNMTRDLSEHIDIEFKKMKEMELNCQIHDRPKSFYCQTCDIEFCDLCHTFHDDHQNFNLCQQKITLETNIEKAR